jgi:hypothetical protein
MTDMDEAKGHRVQETWEYCLCARTRAWTIWVKEEDAFLLEAAFRREGFHQGRPHTDSQEDPVHNGQSMTGHRQLNRQILVITRL